MSGRNQSQVISLQGRSLLLYRYRSDLQGQLLHESLSQGQSLHESISQDQSPLNRDLPREPEIDLSDFWAQSHRSSV